MGTLKLAVTVCCALVEWLADMRRPLQESLVTLSPTERADSPYTG